MNRSHFLFLFITLFSIQFVQAQYRFGVSAGESYEQEFESVGTHIRLYYNLHENIRFHGAYTLYYDKVENSATETVTNKTRSFDLNINYRILIGKRFSVYPILGFNYTYGSEVVEKDGATVENGRDIAGVNAGFGIDLTFNRFSPYLESNSVIAGRYWLVSSIGLRYNLIKIKED